MPGRTSFPLPPEVNASKVPGARGIQFDLVSALAGTDTEAYIAELIPIGRDQPYDAQDGLDRARDGVIKSGNAVIRSEAAMRVGGHDGRRVLATMPVDGKTEYLELREVWVPAQRTVILLGTLEPTPTLSPKARAFFDSFSITADGRGPLDEAPPKADVPITTGALDFQVIRHGDKYVLRDAMVEATFPMRPVVTRFDGAEPKYGFVSTCVAEEYESYGMSGLIVPAGTPYDVEKGIRSGLDAMSKTLTNPHHTETKVKIAGLDGLRATITGTSITMPVQIDTIFVWDAKHRMLINITATTRAKATTPAGRAFLDSLVLHPEGNTPPPPGKK